MGRPGRWPGYAPLAIAALRLAPLRQATAPEWNDSVGYEILIVAAQGRAACPARFASPAWGILIVANGEG
jgi:hypothetical protein